jgi:hypothetical protein
MRAFQLLFAFISPSSPSSRELTSTERSVMAILAFLLSLIFGAVWGLAAGGQGGHLATALQVPVLIAASSIAALPLGLVCFRLTTSQGRASDLLVAQAAATFAATLVLLLLSPIIALYQHSSVWAGPYIALGSVFVAVAVALAILLRSLGKLMQGPGSRRMVAFPLALLWIVQLSTLLQLASVMRPVFPERTVFGRGIDSMAGLTEDRRSSR